jgi:hypothetical protein
VRRPQDDTDEIVGQDSFLDVVTNIVGILILLVMVAGLRSSQAVATSSQQAAAARPTSEEDMRVAYEATAHAERDARDMVHRAVAARDEAALREQERFWLSTTVAEAEQAIAARRAELTTEEQRDYDLRRKITEAQITLEELTREQVALISQGPAVEEIECEPTPLGKVVKGREVHLMLCDDYIAVVPFDALLDLMQEDARANLWRLKHEDELNRTIGPVDGFRLRYSYVKTDVVARSDAGTMMTGNVLQFSRCDFLPVTTPAGEPADEALQPHSALARFLATVRPDTTVTIWTYPGNYDRLRELKRSIRACGLPIAVRPLGTGMPIGASRSGSESISE